MFRQYHALRDIMFDYFVTRPSSMAILNYQKLMRLFKKPALNYQDHCARAKGSSL